MQFFIDLGGHARRTGKQDVLFAVRRIGYIYVDAIDRHDDARSAINRTVIVSLTPGLPSELALAALGYLLADLEADRIVVVAVAEPMQCSIFTDGLLAMRRIGAIVGGERNPATPASTDQRLM